jgi:hypothetical protein
MKPTVKSRWKTKCTCRLRQLQLFSHPTPHKSVCESYLRPLSIFFDARESLFHRAG